MNTDNSKPNPEYEQMVREGIGWDPFADSADRYKRIMVGPGPRVSDLLCPGCKKLSDVIWGGLKEDGSIETTCVECGHVRRQ